MGRTSQTNAAVTSDAILDIAERLVQRRGFNGFSYADIAPELGITKASLHYHFRSKAELGESLILRYTGRFDDALVQIDQRPLSPLDKLRAYCDIYRAVLAGHRMCLCGMLAAEFETLPDPMRQAVTTFFDHNEAWLRALLDNGRVSGDLTFAGSPRLAARSVIAALEGAMLVSRSYGDTAMLDAVAERTVAEFSLAPDGREAKA
jgi:TetR/AcrR family transcriptional regulator, transcriptional repressor for nem operon